jgi:hypothetical protein
MQRVHVYLELDFIFVVKIIEVFIMSEFFYLFMWDLFLSRKDL